MTVELLIDNGKKVLSPTALEGIEWTTERTGTPGKLTFKVLADSVLDVSEGNKISFKWDGNKIFIGYIFSKKTDKENVVTITAYDQLRYLKNKDTYVYENKTASQVVKMICDDFSLKYGTIEDTKYRIATRTEDGQSLFEIINNALDITLSNSKNMYILYDDFGKITLKNIANMRVNCLIDEETGINYDYETSIDDNTYNKIKLYYDNEKTSGRDIYIAQDTKNMSQWGVLQHYESISEGENGQVKADALLDLYNVTTRKLTIKNAFGNCKVRAGSFIPVIMDLVDTKIRLYMLVESCTHNFNKDEHMMDLKLRGGAINV